MADQRRLVERRNFILMRSLCCGYDLLDSGDGCAGVVHDGIDVCLHGGLRQGVKGLSMLFLSAIVTVLLFIYLLSALLRPEWF